MRAIYRTLRHIVHAEAVRPGRQLCVSTCVRTCVAHMHANVCVYVCARSCFSVSVCFNVCICVCRQLCVQISGKYTTMATKYMKIATIPLLVRQDTLRKSLTFRIFAVLR